MNLREFIIAEFKNANYKVGQCLSIPTIEVNARNSDLEFEHTLDEEIHKMIRDGLLERELESRTLVHLTKKGFELI